MLLLIDFPLNNKTVSIRKLFIYRFDLEIKKKFPLRLDSLNKFLRSNWV